jgi:hypothetical protein
MHCDAAVCVGQRLTVHALFASVVYATIGIATIGIVNMSSIAALL